MSRSEPSGQQIQKAAVNAIRLEVDRRQEPGQKRSKGQSAFWYELKEWADKSGEPTAYTPQFVSNAYRTKHMGLEAAHLIRRFYDLTPQAFVERFGKVESRISKPVQEFYPNAAVDDVFTNTKQMDDHVVKSLAIESPNPARVRSTRIKRSRR